MPNARDLIERARMFEEYARPSATLFAASATERWRPITDRYRSNIKEQLRFPSANSH
jgi:hypothetical protein